MGADLLPDIEGVIAAHPEGIGIQELIASFHPVVSRRTLQRRLERLLKENKIVRSGKTRQTRYFPLVQNLVHPSGDQGATDRISDAIPLSDESRTIIAYVRRSPAVRQAAAFDRSFIEGYRFGENGYLDRTTRKRLRQLGQMGVENRQPFAGNRETRRRLLIDLSWASSRLSGSSYSRIDTERLIGEGIQAAGKEDGEMQMILNHQRVAELLIDHSDELAIDRYTILNLHGMLSENLVADPESAGRIRQGGVEIRGSVYRPTSLSWEVDDMFGRLLETGQMISDPVEQAFFLLVQLSYLHPFESFNNSVARVAANIPLTKVGLMPLTFVGVRRRVYTDAIVGICEMKCIDLLRDIFIWAYEQTCREYAINESRAIQPDPLRLKYRSELHYIVGEVVRRMVSPARPVVVQYAAETVQETERAGFIAAALEDISRLHDGILSRYRISRSEFARWRAGVACDEE